MPTQVEYPIFRTYTVSDLAGKDYPDGLLPYKEGYLNSVKKGQKELNEQFILTACGILNRTREELFGDQGA